MILAEKRRTFRRLHESGGFVIPNPRNVGGTRYLHALGFKALATTSAGFAHSVGYADGDVTRDMALAHFRKIAHATDLPVNAFFRADLGKRPRP
jgi:2-methylisocitrate lyase-like PEP mutase family enzyme